MSAAIDVQPVVDLLACIKRGDESGIRTILQNNTGTAHPSLGAALFRMAVLNFSDDPLYYRKIRNLWERGGKPQLKPSRAKISVELLSDGTVDALCPYLELFLAAYGLEASIEIAPFDSVAFEAFAGGGKEVDVSIVVLSERWLRKSFSSFPPTNYDLLSAQKSLSDLALALASKRSGAVAFTGFYEGAWPMVASTASVEGRRPWSAVIASMNETLSSLADSGVYLIDTQQALHVSGGGRAAGALSAIRMRAPFEEAGFLALAREGASAIAHFFGRSHRALLTDWDNTLWGGEVGEVGPEGVELGPETPDGYGYQLVQGYIRDLNGLGVALAAVSRNDPQAAAILDVNPHMQLRRENFAALELSWGNKSDAVSRIVESLNFGADFMVYIDDNHVDLAEVVSRFPEIDVVLAGPDPDQSLRRLAGGRFFNSFRLTAADINRQEQLRSLRDQREAMMSVGSKEEFLASLAINLEVEGLNSNNHERALQLLQKTNQFNLTTRRHSKDDLERLSQLGAKVGVFEYSDRFGSQGIIGLMILVPTQNGYDIDTWLMSCRVLNRGVERAMLDWAIKSLESGTLSGVYIPTEKNGLVSGLYRDLGFRDVEAGRYELDVVSEQ